jgi:hypothetical protein
MEAFKIVLFSIGAAIVYGIVHDQVTAHICVEYFTVAHPPVFPTRSQFWLAVGWGIIATWWVGLILGVLLALAARVGKYRKLALADLRRSILFLMAFSGITALLAGMLGGLLAASDLIILSDEWADRIPPGKHVAFLAVGWAHSASYMCGALGGLLVIGRTIAARRKHAEHQLGSGRAENDASPRPGAERPIGS